MVLIFVLVILFSMPVICLIILLTIIFLRYSLHKHHHKNHLLLHGMIPPQMRRVKSQILESFACHPKEINNLLNY